MKSWESKDRKWIELHMLIEISEIRHEQRMLRRRMILQLRQARAHGVSLRRMAEQTPWSYEHIRQLMVEDEGMFEPNHRVPVEIEQKVHQLREYASEAVQREYPIFC